MHVAGSVNKQINMYECVYTSKLRDEHDNIYVLLCSSGGGMLPQFFMIKEEGIASNKQ